jgi:hypothetical protein
LLLDGEAVREANCLESAFNGGILFRELEIALGKIILLSGVLSDN